LPKVFQYL